MVRQSEVHVDAREIATLVRIYNDIDGILSVRSESRFKRPKLSPFAEERPQICPQWNRAIEGVAATVTEPGDAAVRKVLPEFPRKRQLRALRKDRYPTCRGRLGVCHKV